MLIKRATTCGNVSVIRWSCRRHWCLLRRIHWCLLRRMLPAAEIGWHRREERRLPVPTGAAGSSWPFAHGAVMCEERGAFASKPLADRFAVEALSRLRPLGFRELLYRLRSLWQIVLNSLQVAIGSWKRYAANSRLQARPSVPSCECGKRRYSLLSSRAEKSYCTVPAMTGSHSQR